MARLAAACLALACLLSAGFARADKLPITAWGSAPFLSRATESKAVPAAEALGEIFSSVAGLEGSAPDVLAGVINTAAAGQPSADAVVVLASSAQPIPAAVQQKVAELAGAAAGSLALPNAEHEGASHPVFAGLRASASRLAVKVLGDCGGSLVPSAAPATAEALRSELAEAASTGSSSPVVLILCPSAEGDADGTAEAELLGAAQLALSELVPRHLMLHVSYPAGAPLAAEQRRRLSEVAALMARGKGGGGRNRTDNYTTCDPVCRKHVMWFEGLIVFIVILSALLVGCTCMHMVNVPTRFAQPEQSRQHGD